MKKSAQRIYLNRETLLVLHDPSLKDIVFGGTVSACAGATVCGKTCTAGICCPI
jgi:hypothetical protein